ncbi:hypothetical protein C1O66_06355 [Paucibacter aquatile]|uniref:Uncharacterized protein n=1 Tax=Kinneretia aquatilis TaxID=2070761 RepID=A0A2N8KUR5_9BURK|nr:MAG: hypothetical protein CFE41_22110 [Burkholderiales bacterium PBB2]PND37191.1 hypothetical protein C1O66_06355 [Paucibacter aquatile]
MRALGVLICSRRIWRPVGRVLAGKRVAPWAVLMPVCEPVLARAPGWVFHPRAQRLGFLAAEFRGELRPVKA